MLKTLKNLFTPKPRTFAEIDVQRYMKLHIDLLKYGLSYEDLPSTEIVSYYYPATKYIGKGKKRKAYTVWIHRVYGHERQSWRTPVFSE